jgi:hypothetical protein
MPHCYILSQEGSSYNKAVEIYNPTNAGTFLSGFTLGKTVNGGTTVEYNFTFAAGAVISPGGTYTVCSNRIDLVNQAQCTELTSFISHNGDDVYMLIRNSDDTIIDTFGMLGADPGRAFTVCGDTTATQDHTLIRKPSVYRGNPNWATQIGTDAASCEWIILPRNDFSNGAYHTCVLPQSTLFISEVMVSAGTRCVVSQLPIHFPCKVNLRVRMRAADVGG